MTKLNNNAIQKSLLAEMKDGRATYSTLSTKNGNAKEVGKLSTKARKSNKIPQIEIPVGKTNKAKSRKRGSVSGIPQADRADQIASKTKVPTSSITGKKNKTKSPSVANAKTPDTTPKTKLIKKIAPASSGSKSGIPSAKYAASYTDTMAKGASNLGGSKSNSKKVKSIKPVTMDATTRPVSNTISKSTKKPKSNVKKVNKPIGGNKPKVAKTWKTNAVGINVMESVDVYINGRPKATFGIINKDVINKLVEKYEGFGYTVDLYRGSAAWKKDRTLLRSIFESMDAHYNNAPVSAKRARGLAMNRFFELSVPDYNSLYESKLQFSNTVKSAFNRIMDQADTKYRRSLYVVEGMARVLVGDNIIDAEIITQARDTNMALRNFRNELIEEYGFGATIKHIFIDGKKFGPQNITEWSTS